MKTKITSVLVLVALTGLAQKPAATEKTPRNFISEQKAIKGSDFNHVLLKSTPGTDNIGAKPSSTTWQLLCGSMNTYGMVSSNQQPLNYYPQLNAISFIHRKSLTYTTSPGVPSSAESGVVVAEISDDFGNSWDSTCIWADQNQFGRYPQGGIYNPANNTLLSNAYVVGTGVTVDASTFSGNWYASKPLNALNNTASTVAGAQQYYLYNQASYPPNMTRHGWAHQGFTVTDDGVAHALGILGKDLDNTTTMRGYAVMTGTFNGSTFDWKLDSIIPGAELQPDGTKYLTEGQMAWNRAGTIGYMVGIGVRAGATLSNRSYQPIIYKYDKTISSNPTWSLMTQLDFNTTHSTVAAHLPGIDVTYPTTTGSKAALPFTNDFDIAVDMQNNLHLGIIFMSGYSDHPDSLQYYTTFKSLINPTESYRWQHLPGDRPYIYDFIGDGNLPWKLFTIDSMSSESPGFQTGTSGYVENPWNADANGDKLSIDGRLQLGTSPDGRNIFFSWTESDSAFTSSAFKYNNLPDIMVRALRFDDQCGYKINLNGKTNLSVGNDVRVRATLHYMSPTVSAATLVTEPNFESYKFNVPLTVTNSNPYSQETNNATWFAAPEVKFRFFNFPSDMPQFKCTGIDEYTKGNFGLKILPNPSRGNVEIHFDLEREVDVIVSCLDARGVSVMTNRYRGIYGENKLNFDLQWLEKGLYLMQVDVGGNKQVKKLIIY